MQKIFSILFISIFLNSCYSPIDKFVRGYNYDMFLKDPKYASFTYKAKAVSAKAPNAFGAGFGAGHTQLSANEVALNQCQKNFSDCIIAKEGYVYVLDKSLADFNQAKSQSTMDTYISKCEYLGFKKQTSELGQCAMKFYETEQAILLSKKNNSSSPSGGGNTAANLLLLQQSLKMLSPPANQNRNFSCVYNTVGGIVGVNCN